MGEDMRVLDLFSGIGGFSLGLERAGMETVAFCEYDEKCRKVLTKHWPDVPQYNDVRTLTAEQLRFDKVSFDMICGGFPCQPYSTASHGRIVEPRLWLEMGRVIWQTRPKVVLLENVSKAAILEAKKDLGVLGYETVVRKVSAKDCGAPHLRNRWWVCAHTYNKGKFQRAINAEVAKLPKLCKGVWSRSAYCKAVQFSDGFPRKLDGLKQFGNSVIPQIPEAFGRAIMEQEL